MEAPISPLLSCLLLLSGMLVLMETSRRAARQRATKELADIERGLGTIQGVVFAAFVLLVAFTFAGVASRFNQKQRLIAEEANSVATAYLRLQLVPQEAQSELQALLRRYVDSRLETYRRLSESEARAAETAESRKIQEELWTRAVNATLLSNSDPDAGKLLLPALNNMFDITTSRRMALDGIHTPRIIYALLFGLGLLCSLLAGYGMASGRNRSWLHTLGFTAITVIVVYVILDIEYPSTGLIRLEAADQLLVDVRDNIR
jgi:hypothetical protein